MSHQPYCFAPPAWAMCLVERRQRYLFLLLQMPPLGGGTVLSLHPGRASSLLGQR